MFLLDTCTLLWLSTNPDLLSEKAKMILDDAEIRLSVSVISALEIGQKTRKGKLELSEEFPSWFREVIANFSLNEIVIDSQIAIEATQLPLIHKDPADRILIATAQIHKLTLLTPDPFIRQYPDVKVEW